MLYQLNCIFCLVFCAAELQVRGSAGDPQSTTKATSPGVALDGLRELNRRMGSYCVRYEGTYSIAGADVPRTTLKKSAHGFFNKERVSYVIDQDVIDPSGEVARQIEWVLADDAQAIFYYPAEGRAEIQPAAKGQAMWHLNLFELETQMSDAATVKQAGISTINGIECFGYAYTVLEKDPDTSTDVVVWLAPKYQWLPVRWDFLHTDACGMTLDGEMVVTIGETKDGIPYAVATSSSAAVYDNNGEVLSALEDVMQCERFVPNTTSCKADYEWILPQGTCVRDHIAGKEYQIAGCADTSSTAGQSHIFPHAPTDEHTLEQIWAECGLSGEPSLRSLKAKNALIGTLSEDYPSPDKAQEQDSYFPWKCGEHFRMALIIYTEKGDKVLDFFKGIPAGSSRLVGQGNSYLPVPPLHEGTVESAIESASADFEPEGPATCDFSLVRFAELFPELIGQEFSLTFKEFRGHVFYLTDVPKGTAFVWIQTTMDGNRVIQCPIMTELEPEQGLLKRHDIRLFNARYHFFAL